MRKFVLSLGWLGFLPGAPGTYATVVAVGIYLVGVHFGAPVWVWPAVAAVSAAILLVVGVPRDPEGGRSDPKWCVLDEFCGTFITVSAQPTQAPILVAVTALVFFRLFDILKPPPIDLLERLPGSWGVLADDVGAGVLANASIWALRLIVQQV